MLREFWDDKDGGFFYTGNSHEQLISRAKPIFDASIPSGNALAAQLLLRLHHLTGNEEYRARAEKVPRLYYEAMERQPFGFAHLLCALDFYLNKPKEIVIVGDRHDPATQEFVASIHARYLPNVTLQLTAPGDSLKNLSPRLEEKTQIDGKPTAYVCHNYACSAPVTTWVELERLLEG
jgi:uncharacterized protein YyaL (SSP411 family)